ncbi:uncharacterized protein LOC141652067 [Silene latifolia]|uniref:uncharacterized protein LOC141652067 n=1 Tax=Silene latifolia TaxID=37657 RepID=UPI003D7767AC
MNTVITSLNLIRKSEAEGAKYVEDNLFENSKVIIHADDDNCYLGEICFFDFFYNILVLRFKSRSYFQPAKLSMIDDATALDRDAPLRRHSIKTKSGDSVIVLGRYFYEPYDYMGVPGVLSLERFMPDEYDCNELLTIKCRYTRCGDGAPVISTSGGLVGMTFYDLGSGSRPLLPINILARLLEHYKKYGEMRHPSYGFDARNVHLAILPTLLKFQKAFPDIQDGLIVEKVFKDYNAELAGMQVGDVIFSCDGTQVKSFLELWNLMFEKVGKEVELEVARVALKIVQTLRVKVGEASVDEETYRWLRFDYG